MHRWGACRLKQAYRFMDNEILTVFVMVVVFRLSTTSDEFLEIDGVSLCIRRHRSLHSTAGGLACSFRAIYTGNVEGGRAVTFRG